MGIMRMPLRVLLSLASLLTCETIDFAVMFIVIRYERSAN